MRNQSVKFTWNWLILCSLFVFNGFWKFVQYSISFLDSTISEFTQRHPLSIVTDLFHGVVHHINIENKTHQSLKCLIHDRFHFLFRTFAFWRLHLLFLFSIIILNLNLSVITFYCLIIILWVKICNGLLFCERPLHCKLSRGSNPSPSVPHCNGSRGFIN